MGRRKLMNLKNLGPYALYFKNRARIAEEKKQKVRDSQCDACKWY